LAEEKERIRKDNADECFERETVKHEEETREDRQKH